MEVGIETVKIHFIVDKAYYAQEQALAGAGSRRSAQYFAGFSEKNSSNSLTFGAQVEGVDEPRAIFIFELAAYPEPKALSSRDLQELYNNLKSNQRVADLIGASEAFVRQNRDKS